MKKGQTAKEPRVEKPNLTRITLLKRVLQGYRMRLDEELQPHGITTAQLRMLWAVEQNAEVSGAQIARLCSVTPQTGQTLLARMEANGWIRRRGGRGNDRVRVAELTTKGRRLLLRAKGTAEALERRLWANTSLKDLAGLDAALVDAASSLQS